MVCLKAGGDNGSNNNINNSLWCNSDSRYHMRPQIQPVTLWYRFNPKSNRYEYNHYEDDQQFTATPTPKFLSQESAWKNLIWCKKYALLKDYKITNILR